MDPRTQAEREVATMEDFDVGVLAALARGGDREGRLERASDREVATSLLTLRNSGKLDIRYDPDHEVGVLECPQWREMFGDDSTN